MTQEERWEAKALIPPWFIIIFNTKGKHDGLEPKVLQNLFHSPFLPVFFFPPYSTLLMDLECMLQTQRIMGRWKPTENLMVLFPCHPTFIPSAWKGSFSIHSNSSLCSYSSFNKYFPSFNKYFELPEEIFIGSLNEIMYLKGLVGTGHMASTQ